MVGTVLAGLTEPYWTQLGARAYNYTMGKNKMPVVAIAPPAYYGKKRKYKKKGRKSIIGRRPGNIRYGKKHVRVDEVTSGAFNSGNIVDSYSMFSIPIGDRINERNSNNVLSRYITVKLNMYNTITTPRYVRMILVQLRGSTNAAATSTWSDLLMDANYSPVAPSGLADDLIYRVNQDVYRVLHDATVRIGAAASEFPTVNYTKVIKTRSMIKYDFNTSTSVRQGALYMVLIYTESEGLAPNAGSLNYALSLRHGYTDVDN